MGWCPVDRNPIEKRQSTADANEFHSVEMAAVNAKKIMLS